MITKILDRYLLKYFLLALFTVSVAIGLLIIVINMVEELRDFIDNDVPLAQIFEYYLYFAGWVVKSFLPVFILLAALISIGILARRNELLAMKTSGISLYRIAAPLMAFTLLLSFAHIYYNEVIFAKANQRRVEIKEYTINKRARTDKRTVNIFRQVNPNLFYTIRSYNTASREGVDFKLFRSEKNKLLELVVAERITFTSRNWMLYDGVSRYFTDTGETFSEFDSLPATYIHERPSDFEVPLGKPEDMAYFDLQHYINMMKRAGGPYRRELVDLKLKLSYPFSSFIVILICVPIASNSKRGGIALSFALGAGIALLYFICFKITQSFGYNEKLHPDLAAWMVNGVFFLVGLTIMIRSKK